MQHNLIFYNVCLQDGSGSDWRSDLLHAVGEIFSKEREGLLAELRTYSRTTHGQDLPAVERLEKLIREQVRSMFKTCQGLGLNSEKYISLMKYDKSRL